ncbi:hypothetical protein [Microbulbifer thermotolerans]|uniref:Uncharacterized protein n=2 Tax=Microbulbifer thermotolerans TaxID=252514 RepID=A0A143HJM9_MICTH|nr:hypothetical protein [Microbulbifer thermotolerans]AMX01934.1 hypothetical protein A3224_04440 [Microbulbifer thermotolerans]MCX2779153.1 hypothetical protein [Microbulbifer thermotolerans]MCX2783655.1 hypothetical protein [Microbulbifer thermotolerans]MCX2801516.1 hypothetical protein [Microbulbifer thermotolerans]MCX2803577.1 hypothetical protein [Microbulbifer thermotolerans]
MEKIDRFSSNLLKSSDNSQAPYLQLIKGNEPFSGQLKGALIVAQYHLYDGHYLLFITDDIPYEETLRIYLIASNAEVLDSLEFGGYLANGTLEDLNIVGEQAIEFNFIHKKRCRLTVKSDSGWTKPLTFTPGVRRPGGLKKRYLDLEFF